MSGKMIEMIKKIVHIGGAIVSPVLAGLGWLADLASKIFGRGRNPREKREEKSGMFGIILKVVALVGFIVVVCALGKKVKEWLSDKEDPVIKDPEIKTLKVEPVPKVSYQALFARKCELEQRMAGVTGGETGLFMLRKMIRDAASEGSSDTQYRVTYRMKQDKLRRYMKDYRALLKQAEGAPEEEKRRLEPDEDLERYQELLDEKV